MRRTVKIITLRTTEQCPDNRSCTSIHRVADEPDRRYVIMKTVTDPVVIAAFAHLVGDDELLGHLPADLIPEV